MVARKTISVPVDPEPIYFVRSSKYPSYCVYPARLVERYRYRLDRERYRVFSVSKRVSSIGYRAELIRDVSMSDGSLKSLWLLYQKERDFNSDLPF